jgi:hypothetical protein
MPHDTVKSACRELSARGLAVYRLCMNHCGGLRKRGYLEHNFNEMGFQDPIGPVLSRKL